MKIAVLKERRPFERRVAATPETVKKLIALGHQVAVESGAGVESSYVDQAYRDAGAHLRDAATAAGDADLVLKVQRPMTAAEGTDEVAMLKPGATVIAMFSPHSARAELPLFASRQVSALAMELVPRITRAQSMDVLSSQANLAGYRAVLDAATEFGRAFPMMMTAAGTIPPTRVMVMGAGVAGLQAIATARRLGAVVSATDVRMAAKEQVQSLGATFVMVESDETINAETSGGYAKEMSDDFKQRQAVLIAETVKKQDIVICTALIPGRPAPQLLSETMVRSMKPGSVIVDMAVEQGGNCACSKPGEIVDIGGVKIVGYRNIPSRIAVDASALYARNIYNLIAFYHDKESGDFKLNPEDEIIKAMLLTHAGAVVHPQFI
ncbi:MAG: Re/Si-specific NAD(P)(+) transhydrogenase subunit alpha [Alphaproteobacteria bacterium]